MTPLKLAKGYAVVFGFIHLAALILGIRIMNVSSILSDILLLLFAVLCFSGLVWANKWWRLFLAFGWSVSFMVEWTHLIVWAPAFSDLQYTVMAVLNMGMALSLATLSEEPP